MAEAIAALSLASNIIQIVAFTSEVVSKTKALINSTTGILPQNEWIRDTAKQNEELATELDRHASQVLPMRKADAAVSKLAQRCLEESSHLFKLLAQLQVPQRPDGTLSKWQTGKKVLKSSFREHEIEASSQRLERLEIQLCALLLQRIHHSQASEFRNLQDCVLRSKDGVVEAVTRNANRMLQSLEGSQQKILSKLDRIEKLLVYSGDQSRVQTFLASLAFPEMDARRNMIKERSHGTFEWMFEDNGKYFGSWLHSDEPIFWICGEPGSGKSVLVKTLRQHERTRDLIARSSSGHAAEVAIVDSYFWLAGQSPLQKNVVGMLRSIIHQLIASYPGLLQKLPIEIQSRRYSPSWTRTELIDILLQVTVHVKIIMFIDGLDECEGSEGKRTELVDAIKDLCACDNIRACVSSRPSSAFERVFGGLRYQIKLQELTTMDVFHFVRNVLSNYRDLFPKSVWDVVQGNLQRKLYEGTFLNSAERETYNFLLELVPPNESNFLWIDLILDAICERIEGGATIQELRQHVRKAPRKLDEYNEKSILDRINDTYLHETAMAIQLYRICDDVELYNTFPVFWNLYNSLANNDTFHKEAGYGFKIQFTKHSSADVLEKAAATKRWLDGCCRGILKLTCEDWSKLDPDNLELSFVDLSTSGPIQPELIDISPNHRTIMDFVKSPRMEAIVNERAPKHFLKPAIVDDLAMVTFKMLPDSGIVDVTDMLLTYVTGAELMRETLGRVHEAYAAALQEYLQYYWEGDLEQLSKEILILEPDFCCKNLDLIWRLLCVGERDLIAKLLSAAPQHAVVTIAEGDLHSNDGAPFSGWRGAIVDLLMASVASVELLLSYGADPNGPVGPGPPMTRWHSFLAFDVGWGSCTMETSQNTSQDWIQHVRDIIVVLIEHGADVSSPVYLYGRQDSRHPCRSIGRCFCFFGQGLVDIRVLLDKIFEGGNQAKLNALIEHYSQPEVSQSICEARLERLKDCRKALLVDDDC